MGLLTIKERQIDLMFLNYDCGTKNFLVPDGIEGQKTKQAYKNFQRDFGCSVDGVYGAETDGKLTSVIDDIQARVGAKVDSIVGSETIEKTKEWQRNHGLTPDGIAGTKTRNAMANVGEITWDDIKYFGKNEMTCKCGCGLNNTDLRLMQIADGIREHFGSPAVITSGCRCSKHNADPKVGGVQGSRHVLGKAMDFYVQGVPTQELLNYCQQLVNEGQLRYTYTNNAKMNGVVHIDIL